LELVRHVGIDGRTIFWNNKWRGSSTLLVQFPRLYAILNNKEATVFSWKRLLCVWEVNLLNKFFEVADGFNCSKEPDCWKWSSEVNDLFWVKSTYILLEKTIKAGG